MTRADCGQDGARDPRRVVDRTLTEPGTLQRLRRAPVPLSRHAIVPLVLCVAACATAGPVPDTPSDTSASVEGEAVEKPPGTATTASSSQGTRAPGEEAEAYTRTIRDGAARIDALPRGFWLERTLFTTRWPTVLEAVRAETDGGTAVFVATVANRDTGVRRALRIVPGAPGQVLEGEPDAPALRLRAVSPDGRLEAYAESNGEVRLVVADRTTRQETVVLEAPYGGDWSINGVAWSPGGDAVYFDNDGPVACIWRYEVAAERLEKVVPAHSARAPFPFVLDGADQVAYVDVTEERVSHLNVARNLGFAARRAFARGPATLETFPVEWVGLTREGEAWVVRTWCGSPGRRLTIDPKAGTLTVGFGQDERVFDVAAAVPTGPDTVSLVATSPAGAYVEVAELRFLDPDRTLAEVSCFACAGGATPGRFVAADHRDRFKTVGESCR